MTSDPATCPRCNGELPAGACYCPRCGARIAGAPRRLRRLPDQGKLAGVCAGLAEYFDVDPVLVRAIVVVATVFTAVGPGVLLYLLLALVMPRE